MSDYPHWRTALFGNGHVANLRCALKYFVWHGSYLLLAMLTLVYRLLAAVLGPAGRATVAGGERVAPYAEAILGPIGRGLVRAGRGIKNGYATGRGRAVSAASRPAINKILRVVVVGALVVWFTLVVGYVVYLAIMNPIMFLAVCGAIAWGLIILVGGIIFFEDGHHRTAAGAVGSAARTAGERAVETPGVRRVYGNCPVHMDLEPKWFGRVSGSDE